MQQGAEGVMHYMSYLYVFSLSGKRQILSKTHGYLHTCDLFLLIEEPV